MLLSVVNVFVMCMVCLVVFVVVGMVMVNVIDIWCMFVSCVMDIEFVDWF